MANFFWSELEGKKKLHWISWKKLCFPTNEGGVGFGSIQEVSQAQGAKAWWNFRTKDSLWRKFLEEKYCPRAHPVAKKWAPGQYHTWKRLLESRKECEKLIVWKVAKGNISFW